ncbi:uncharacterized protein [Palaemon carinicauda]|uniref:uncharacterized protein isoform X2 n=1 Tax=Palaemon carinicauda TaxID=392227 RepID=UPI0035B6A66B
MDISHQIPLSFAAFWFLFTSLFAAVTPNMEKSRDCAIRQRLEAERAYLSSFSFDAFFLLSAMHVQVTNGNRCIRIYVTENATAILTNDFKYEEKLLPRRISGWTSFILSVTDTVHLVTQDGIDITGLLEKENLRIDPSQDFKADISNVPLMSGCIEGGPTVSVNPVGELNLLTMLPMHQHNFTILGSQFFNLSMFINDHKITSLCGKGSADFTLEFHATNKQEHRIIIPGTQPLSFNMTPKSSDGSKWITVSFHTTGQALHVAYNLPWKERLTSLQKPGFVKLCSFDEYFGRFELAVLVLILIILLIIVLIVVALVFLKSRRKTDVLKGEFPFQQSTPASPSFQLARNWNHFPRYDPNPLKIPALFGKEPSNTAMEATFAKSYNQEFDEQMHEENIYEEIIAFGQITLTSSSASYCNYPVTDIIEEDKDGYVNMTKYKRDRECTV